MDLDQIRSDYQKALRAWHVAWMARVDWHRKHFYPLTDREQSLAYEPSSKTVSSSETQRSGPTTAS